MSGRRNGANMQRDERRRAGAALGAVLVVLAVVFAPGLTHRATTLDDEAIVFRNPVLRAFGWRELSAALDPRASRLPWGLQYTPVRDLSHALDLRLFGDDPGPHHLQGLLLHALATAALFVLVLRLGGSTLAAGVGAAVFAVHPLQVEAVSWISGRTVPLAGAFLLWALVAWHAARTSGRRTAYAVALVLFLLANLSKQSAVAGVVLLAGVEWAAARVIAGRHVGAPGSRWPAYAPLVLLAVAFTLLGMWVGHREGIIAPAGRELGAQVRLTLSALAWYAEKLVVPMGLMPAYDLRPPARWVDARVLSGAAALVAAGLAVLATRRRTPLAAFGVAAALVTVLPGAHGLGTQVVADRYAYLPVAGFAIALGATLAAAARRAPRLVALGVVAGTLLLAATSSARVAAWRDDVTLYGDAAAKDPGNRLWHHMLARALADAGRDTESAVEARRAALLGDGHPVDGYCPLPPVLSELALLREREGDLAAAESTLAAGLEVARAGEVDRAAVDLGAFYLRRGDRERARFAYLAAIAREPGTTPLSQARAAWLDALAAEEAGLPLLAPPPAFGQDASMAPDQRSGSEHKPTRVVYSDPRDPRVVVPKTTGPGWTINFAHPWAVPALLLAFAIAVGPGLLLVLSGAATVGRLVAVEAASIGVLVGLASWLAKGR